METISIKELHQRTGAWIRAAVRKGELLVSDRGKPVAVIRPFAEPGKTKRKWNERPLSTAYRHLLQRRFDGDSTAQVSDGRDRY